MNFYKATRTDGTDFRTGTIDYADALASGELVNHPRSGLMVPDSPGTYLSVSVESAETLIGGSWPCRLFRVEPVGDVLGGLSASRSKRACKQLRVVEELPAWQALGPNGRTVAAIIERVRTITREEAGRLSAAWDAAWGAARDAARDTAWDAARDTAWDAARGAARDAAWGAARGAAWGAARGAAWDAARDAVWGALVHDLLTDAEYRALTGPWIDVIGDPFETDGQL